MVCLSRFPYFCFVVLLLLSWAVVWNSAEVCADSIPSADPNATCAPCHRDIYERYRKTPMATASGPASEGLIPGDFRHAASGVHYRVFTEQSKVWLSFDREDPKRSLNGRRQLEYFIGSGKRGRTYLFQEQSYWFEAPINWYAKKRTWDMAPNHLADREMPLTLPVDAGCLHCHASGAASALPDARNHYAGAPFAEGGITCAACHGDGAAHSVSPGKVHMTDIDALQPVRRDSVCLNCHLEGQASVDRKGKKPEAFKPGDDLFDFTSYFVYKRESGSGGRATSQWEALLKSECKRKSGERMTCTTCHDPHGPPPAQDRVAFYRQRCLRCHSQAGFQEKHHTENPDCTACHMARPPSSDIAHEQVTDHWIRKRVSQERLPLITAGELEPVGDTLADDRDLGLAYAQMAARGDQQADIRAVELLQRAEKEAGGAPQDHELHAQLGFLRQLNGQTSDAASEYRQALIADANDSLARGNLALIEAREHRIAEAAQLWRTVFDGDPEELGAGLNLAIVECRSGQRDEALKTLNRLLAFAPDNDTARTLTVAIESNKLRCDAH